MTILISSHKDASATVVTSAFATQAEDFSVFVNLVILERCKLDFLLLPVLVEAMMALFGQILSPNADVHMQTKLSLIIADGTNNSHWFPNDKLHTLPEPCSRELSNVVIGIGLFLVKGAV